MDLFHETRFDKRGLCSKVGLIVIPKTCRGHGTTILCGSRPPLPLCTLGACHYGLEYNDLFMLISEPRRHFIPAHRDLYMCIHVCTIINNTDWDWPPRPSSRSAIIWISSSFDRIKKHVRCKYVLLFAHGVFHWHVRSGPRITVALLALTREQGVPSCIGLRKLVL